MRSVIWIGWLIVGGIALISAPAEGIRGQLVITRALTKQRIVLPMYEDRGVSSHKHADAPATPINEWDRVAVYLEGNVPGKTTPVTAILSQNGERFDPDMIVIPVGTTVSFPNFDPIFHNVFSLSKAREFDLGYYPAGQTRTVKFDKSGVVQVYCHLHPEMNASILIVPNGWYTRPSDQGVFAFPEIPPGDYQVVAWHKSAGFFRKHVHVSQGTLAQVSMEIPIGANEPGQ